jgi:protein SCO1/2
MIARRFFIASAVAGAALPVLPAGASRYAAKFHANEFPNPLLATHTGQRLRFYDDVVKGSKVLVFNMMYASCRNICPPNTAGLLQVQKLLRHRMGRDVFFYSLTLQPDLDRPACMHMPGAMA